MPRFLVFSAVGVVIPQVLGKNAGKMALGSNVKMTKEIFIVVFKVSLIYSYCIIAITS